MVLHSFMPHMHVRGKSFRYTIVYPDGREEIALDVPRYDFGWQLGYHLAEPLKLPAGARIDCVAHFDNSRFNLAQVAEIVFTALGARFGETLVGA